MEFIHGSDHAIPVTILTGFLGAGKTTLLNRILNGDHGLRVAVLVNDFGSINIDAELVVGIESDVIALANGCVCCQIRDDLIETVEEVIGRPERPEYILLEASGVADPSGIALTFVDSKFKDRIRLDSITCVVDCEQVFSHSEDPMLAELKLRQVAFSDMVILNKVDLVAAEQIEKVTSWINDRLNRVRVVQASHCNVPLEILLAVGRFDPARSCHNPMAKGHAQSFTTWSYETDQPMSMEALQEVARKQLPETIYRCKGVIYTVEAPENRAILQLVGRRISVTLLDAWGERTPRTKIVAIGNSNGINADLLQEKFENCLVPISP
jgi:G3E family GTPase